MPQIHKKKKKECAKNAKNIIQMSAFLKNHKNLERKYLCFVS